MAMDSSALRELARDLGVGTDYWGWDGNRRDVDDDTLRAVLAGLGTPVSGDEDIAAVRARRERSRWEDRKSTRLNSSHVAISYAVFCLKKKIKQSRDTKE